MGNTNWNYVIAAVEEMNLTRVMCMAAVAFQNESREIHE